MEEKLLDRNVINIYHLSFFERKKSMNKNLWECFLNLTVGKKKGVAGIDCMGESDHLGEWGGGNSIIFHIMRGRGFELVPDGSQQC